MRLDRWLVAACCAGMGLGAAPAFAQSSQALTIGAAIGPATSLRVSSSILILDAAAAATGSRVVGRIDIDARARARSAAEVVLTVEALQDPGSLGGGPDAEPLVIGFDGEGAGLVAGILSVTPHVVGRWVGSGVRQGQVVFALRSGGVASGATVPLRFVLSVP